METSQINEDLWREHVRREWTDRGTVDAWRKWHHDFASATVELTQAIVNIARIEPGMQVLDIASGTGEPALTISGLVGDSGHVLATDISAGMLETAEENARQLGLTNISFEVADGENLPFPDATFDRVTSRLGVMYFADSVRGLSEMRRVLKPGGRVALAANGPYEEATTITSTVGVLLKYVNLPPPEPGTPNPFNFANAGTLATAMKAAGFESVEEESRSLRLVWPRTVEHYWQSFEEMAAPFRAYVDELPDDTRERAIREVFDTVRQYEVDGELVFSLTTILATGLRDSQSA